MRSFQRIRKWPKWLKITLTSLIVLIICLRIALPFIVKRYVNKTINELDGYSGYVEDIDIALIRGAYVIKGIHIYSDEMGKKVPILDCRAIDLSVQWHAIFQGRIVGEVVFERAIVNFENVKSEKTTNNFDDVEPTDWREALLNLMPLKINYIQFDQCEVHFIDRSTSPQVDVYVADINGRISHLTNKEEKAGDMIADYDIRASAMKAAPMRLYGKFDPYDKKITLDANFEMRGLPVPKTNDYLMAYTYTDAEGGTLDFFVELAVQSGQCRGYFKPLLKNLKLVSLKHDKFPNIVWQAVVGGVTKLVENWRHDQVATKIPIEGDISAPKAAIWPTLRELFRNWLIRALSSSLDRDVDLGNTHKSKKELRQERREERKAEKKKKD